jgi:hypothetical protein
MDNDDLVKAINNLSGDLRFSFRDGVEPLLGQIRDEVASVNNQRLIPSDFIWKYAPMIAIHRNIPIEDAIEIAKEMYKTLDESTKRF